MSLCQPVDYSSRLLVVDDDRGIRELLSGFLAEHGYLVEMAENGAAMRAALAAGSFDLAIMDVMMPGEDGLSLLRSLDPASRPPVILMSVMGSEVDRIVGLEMGADDYLAKPFNPREMLARVRAVLRRNVRASTATAEPVALSSGGYGLQTACLIL
jgi:two-component system, OmpR family, response regulator